MAPSLDKMADSTSTENYWKINFEICDEILKILNNKVIYLKIN